MKIPKYIPQTGFYYHYKHDPNGPVNNFAYEVLNVGCHTEDDCRPEDANMVIYRPLYEDANVYKAGKLWDLRPLEMFTGTVTKGGLTHPRFTFIEDPEVIQVLSKIRDKMY